ncbi:TRAP transporter small permease subunit [Marinomonas mediterranea]|jgi:TRAP-type mannitol/chloroaromatic compound transport system, small permease component|uniref:TRAP transporter small permease protein n=1 Tax=Marinomonas mediterranea (strain ATCC 700492 / JCM 21426 / NBRC 103028 / MMB-1) TaxID=717774 RepID=F2K0B8_MARM1|nr:TRAP transporter small permease subunit [Marinomonas mediterranea]ADZ89833.1 Tripartite ATP-independent periplasmic transporter DctQ component [Marinomonas mediterranea MMB-1]WCN07921.1 TRAP transporter small permease subunit [Marinomonas mediterranea]WCN12016.1 TRAP transporter small permease subunit [Marinomonas mediterranea]WCN16053.1 TRAP transporter small permease subunit [Marinomonas mediterranea MMB-1]
MFLVKLEKTLGKYSLLLGKVSAVLLILLLFNVFYDVLMRYLFNDVSIAMQELEWHLYSAIFLLGIPFGLQVGGHVRVDLVYERLSIRGRAWIDLIGTLIFLLPFCLLVGYYGVGFAKEAYELGETSGDPGGLPARWIIKAVIPVAFFSIAISGLGMLLRCINAIRGISEDGFKHEPIQH